jgi:hypothetical protein
VKKILLWACLPFLSGCAALTADPWGWMDDPAQQRWVEIHAIVEGHEVRFSVPDRVDGVSNFTRSNLALRDAGSPIEILVPSKTEYIGNRFATFNWDYWWGGFFRGSGTDFFLSVQSLFWKEAENLLDLMPAEFMAGWTWRYTELFYPWDGDPHVMGELFFERYRTGLYTTSNGLNWVQENNPMVQPTSLKYMTPIGRKHILFFGFFINEKSRNGNEPDPEWVERRWAMARKILDTVEITPRPGKF